MVDFNELNAQRKKLNYMVKQATIAGVNISENEQIVNQSKLVDALMNEFSHYNNASLSPLVTSPLRERGEQADESF